MNMKHTLMAISNDCHAWCDDESDITAEDLIFALRDAADSALSNTNAKICGGCGLWADLVPGTGRCDDCNNKGASEQ